MPSDRPMAFRVALDGKFFRIGQKKFYPKGVTYGPFAPNPAGEPFASPEKTRADFRLISELGANLLRIYNVPPPWLLEMASEFSLHLLVDISWPKHLCFLDSPELCESARQAVRQAIRAGAGHPAIFAYSLVNEIPPDIARWSGADAIAAFIDELVDVAKEADPQALCTFASYPPTEFLRPRTIDFFCFNVYLHQQRPFENYLARLQMIADSRPLLLGEFGIDSLREGEQAKCEILSWQIETIFRAGLAGAILYSFTDDWFKDGRQIEDWGFGLTTTSRERKPSYEVVRKQFAAAPYFPLAQSPKVSVVVASYNGARTLATCLSSLEHLNYPNYEVILVDDGSTDETPKIARQYSNLRYFRQENMGLSAARNTGIFAAEGEIIAFTDSDCRADEDWLYYLVSDLLKARFIGIGGHNFLPPEDSPTAAAVLVSPGGPAHVMLTDRIAEHIPGCNMAFYKLALLEIGGFDPIYRKAGDDVDICWRLQQRGYRIGFSPGAFVWHHRRSTVKDYLRQQSGYGESEALLVRRHPEYFNSFGGSVWQGRIYTGSKFGVLTRRPIIYHGLFASGFFQTLYTAEPAVALMLCTSLEYHVLVTLPLTVLSVPFHYLWPLAITSMSISVAVCVAAAIQADLPRNRRRWWSRSLIALLFFLQPVVRGWARYRGRLSVRPTPQAAYESLIEAERAGRSEAPEEVRYWAENGMDRLEFLGSILARLEREGWQHKIDTGWSDFDAEIYGSRWGHLQLTTVAEPQPDKKQIFRCRLRSKWSLPATVAFWSALGFELLVIGFIRDTLPEVWLLLLIQLVFGWFIEQEQKDLRRLIAGLLDEVAASRGLVRIRRGKRAGEKGVA